LRLRLPVIPRRRHDGLVSARQRDGAVSVTSGASGTYRSLVPARLDRLPWRPFHTRVVTALGVSWILDGLEIQIISQISIFLEKQHKIVLTAEQAGLLGALYLFGEVVGALVFGWITDRLGRKKLFFVTLTVYLLSSAVGAFSPALWFLALFRFVAGMGIGGEYAAINSAIDELIPPYYRGRADIYVSGTYWAGAALGAAANLLLLNPHVLPTDLDLGWRLGFVLGPALGLGTIFLRRAVPESPRWLMTHGRQVDAELVVGEIEAQVWSDGVELQPIPESKALAITGRGKVSYRQFWRTMWIEYPRRSIVSLSLMISQAFLYNAIFFTNGQVLVDFYHIKIQDTGYYLIPFAVANLLGPLALGKKYDIIGRRKMIALAYGVSGALMVLSAPLSFAHLLNATSQTVLWCVTFFFASAGTSAAYLTVSEIFPLELRALAFASFFALSLLVGGVPAPLIYEHFVTGSTSHLALAIGYGVAGVAMAISGIIAGLCGVKAERKSLERIAPPLSAAPRPIEPSLESP